MFPKNCWLGDYKLHEDRGCDFLSAVPGISDDHWQSMAPISELQGIRDSCFLVKLASNPDSVLISPFVTYTPKSSCALASVLITSFSMSLLTATIKSSTFRKYAYISPTNCSSSLQSPHQYSKAILQKKLWHLLSSNSVSSQVLKNRGCYFTIL